MKQYYEVLFFTKEENESEEQATRNGDYETRKFGGKKRALAWYEKHKDDKNKCAFWVTRRDDETGEVLEDLVY